MLTAPLGIGAAAGMAAGTALGTLAAGACAVTHLIVVSLSAGAVRAAGAVLRAADSAMLRIRNIRMFCPVCFQRVPYPGYLCPDAPTCKRAHRDVRPGRFGIVRRRCRVRQADEDPAAVRVGADDRLLPALRPRCWSTAPDRRRKSSCRSSARRARARPGCCSAWSPSCRLWTTRPSCSPAEFANSATTSELGRRPRTILRSGTSTSATLHRTAPRSTSSG